MITSFNGILKQNTKYFIDNEGKPFYYEKTRFARLKYLRINKNNEIENKIKILIKKKGPVICELITDPDSNSLFKQGYKKNERGIFEPMNLGEMYPFINAPIANTNN